MDIRAFDVYPLIVNKIKKLETNIQLPRGYSQQKIEDAFQKLNRQNPEYFNLLDKYEYDQDKGLLRLSYTSSEEHIKSFLEKINNEPRQQPSENLTTTFAKNRETVKVQCECGQEISFRYLTGMEYTIITCPKCQRKIRISSMKRCLDSEPSDNRAAEKSPNLEKAAVLRLKDSPKTYKLSEGRNLIGRKVATSRADIQLDIETRHLPQDLLIIEGVKTSEGIEYYARLFTEHVYDTYIGNYKLEEGIIIRLKDGDEIRLPGVTIFFELQ